MFAYKLQIRHSLTEHDCASRLTFAQWMVELLDATPDLLGRIWFSDESHFHLDGHVNKQNCRFWGSQKPDEVLECPLHSAKVTVWCAMSSQGLIEPFFFEENGSAVTVNGARYRIMLQTFFFPQLKALVGKNKLSQQWYQQDGATAHTANNTLDVLRNKFGD